MKLLKVLSRAMSLLHYLKESLLRLLWLYLAIWPKKNFHSQHPQRTMYCKAMLFVVTFICNMRWTIATNNPIECDHGAIRLDFEPGLQGSISGFDKVTKSLPSPSFWNFPLILIPDTSRERTLWVVSLPVTHCISAVFLPQPTSTSIA